MAGEYELGGLNGESAENFDLSQVFNTQQTPELNQPQTYSWNDFFDPQYSNQIGDKWEPQQYLSLGSNNPVDVSQYTFTSLPYQYKEGYVADIKTPSFEGFRPMPNVWRGGNAGYFTDNGGLPYMQQSGKWVVPVGDKSEGTFQRFLDQAVPLIAGGMVTGGLGGGLAGAFGGGVLGSAAGYGLAGGTTAEIQGGDFGKGFLGGAVSGGLQGLGASGNSPAKFAGIENPTLAKMFNRGAGGTLGALASGKSGSEALQSGVMGAGLAGANALGSQAMDFFGNAFKGLMPQTTGGDEFDALQGSGGDMTGQTDVSPNRYDEFVTGSDGMETFNPDYRFGGDQMMDSFSSPSQSIQSAGQPSFSLQSVLGDVGSRVGNFALNNAGDLASMLYGFYNNRRQQRQLQQPMNNMSNQVNQATTQLQNLFTQNSPYAQQLRAKLNAQAAASGRRSNVAGRETQFQAMLAEKAASTLPQIANMQNSLMQNQLQMQQQQGRLKNSNMNDVLNFAKQSGLLGMAGQGLKNLFSNDNTYAGGGYNMTGVQNPYGSDVIFNGWGG